MALSRKMRPSFCWRDIRELPTSRSRKFVLSHSHLYVGLLVPELATLYISGSGKTYSAEVYVPGIEISRKYGPLDEMKAEVERAVGLWLVLAGASIGPVLTDGGGI